MASRPHFCVTIVLLALVMPRFSAAQQSTSPAAHAGHSKPTDQGHASHKYDSQTPPAKGADHLEHKFHDAREWAKMFDDPARDEWQMPARVIETLNVAAGQAVADIGAGTGYFTVRLARTSAAPNVYAVDVEPSMLEHIRHRAASEGLKNVVPILAAADRTKLPEPVDVALMVDTYHHIPNRVEYFTALRSLLKPGGRLAIIDFRKDSPSGPPVEFRFTPEQITAEMKQAGFALHTSHDFLPRQVFLIFQAVKQ